MFFYEVLREAWSWKKFSKKMMGLWKCGKTRLLPPYPTLLHEILVASDRAPVETYVWCQFLANVTFQFSFCANL